MPRNRMPSTLMPRFFFFLLLICKKITVKKIGIENPRKFFSKSDKISSGKMLRTTTFDTLG